MDSIQLLRRLHQHRAWVNQNLLTAASRLDETRLRQSFDIGQGSVWKTLVHLYAAEFIWLEALNGNEDPVLPGDLPGRLPGNQLGEGCISGLDELIQLWRVLDHRWEEYLSSISSASLDELVYKVSTSSGLGKRFGTRRGDVLLHVCTHAQYTTAQMLNMLRQCGLVELPETMLISLARHEALGDV